MSTMVSRNVQIIITMSNRITGPARRISDSLWGIFKAARAAQYGMQQLAHVVGYFIRINREMEDLQLGFAGIIRANDLADTFADAQSLSRGFVQEIRNQAGKLPGSLQQYVEIARQSYGELSNIGFKTVREQAEFIGQYGAVALTLQVPAAQAGRDLMLMLSGNARLTTRTWTLLRHQINMTLGEWRALTQEQRHQKLAKALAAYNDMVKAAEHTWEAASGAFGTHVQDIARMASAPYFEALKSFLHMLNDVLADNKKEIALLFRWVVKLTLALAVLKAVDMGMRAKGGGGLGRVLLRERPGTLLGAAKAGHDAMIDRFVLGVGRWNDGLRRGMHGPARMTVGQGGPLAMIAGLRAAFLGFGATILPVVAGVALLTAAMGLLAYGIAKNVGGMRDELYRSVYRLVGMFQPFFDLITGMQPGMSAIEQGAMAVGAFVDAIVKAVSWVLQLISTVFGFLGAQLAHVFTMLGQLAQGNLVQANAARQNLTPAGQWKEFWEIWKQVGADADKRAKEAVLKQELNQKAPNTRNGPPVYNFQHSKFTITQQFAEGFDPDRIAVAFADDLADLANRRLQSSFSPVGAI